ncbi:MAG: hypothetical protein HYR55_06790 [Acidobacteria bacterium]|nr:hypothetical protein [Acidobacteriota bacterium]MBI3655821.1 hypothetical protein [Acidobacteriota bacterium]
MKSWYRLSLMVLLILSFAKPAASACNLPLLCTPGPLPAFDQTCTISGEVPLDGGTYSCDRTKLVFSPAGPYNVARLFLRPVAGTGAAASLTLTNSDVDDSASKYLFQDGIFVEGNSQLVLNGVTVTSPQLFFIEANPSFEDSNLSHTASITVGSSAAPDSKAAARRFTEIRLNQSSRLSVPTANCPGGLSCTELFDVLVRDTANLTLNGVKMHNLFLEANGAFPPAAITLADIYNGDGENNQLPVTFSCQPSPGPCPLSGSCCYGTPYQATVIDTTIQVFRFNINNGGTANLTRLGASIVDFETSGGCSWVFNDGDLPVAPGSCDLSPTCNPNTNPNCCPTKLIRKDCLKNNNVIWRYAANLTQMNVNSYAFGALALKLSTVPDDITIQDRFTHITEVTTMGDAKFTVYGKGSPPQSGSPSTKMGSSSLSAAGHSQITIEKADLSVSGNGSFIAMPEKTAGGTITGAKLFVRDCTVGIKYLKCPTTSDPNKDCQNGAYAGIGATIHFGAAGDTSCDRPALIPTKDTDEPICEGSGLICYACNEADAAEGRCTLRHFVNICQNPFATGGRWPETDCPNSQP